MMTASTAHDTPTCHAACPHAAAAEPRRNQPLAAHYRPTEYAVNLAMPAGLQDVDTGTSARAAGCARPPARLWRRACAVPGRDAVRVPPHE